VTGEDTQDIVEIRQGFEGDVGPDGAPDTCGGGDRLCFLTVGANKPITAQGACQRDGSDSRVRCAYFHEGSQPALHRYRATVKLRGGSNDRVRIVQGAIADCCQAVTTPELAYPTANAAAGAPQNKPVCRHLADASNH
jgi:hypothetical protein